MLNDRQTLIKAAGGSPPVTVGWWQRGDDRCRDRSSMPGLDQGQGSRIRQRGWTLLASSQTIHSPQSTSTTARLSHLRLDGPEPCHTGVLEQGAGEVLIDAEFGVYTIVLTQNRRINFHCYDAKIAHLLRLFFSFKRQTSSKTTDRIFLYCNKYRNICFSNAL